MSTKRWIEANSEATELERVLLASGLDAEPPAEAEAAVWRSLTSALGVPAAVAGITAASSASATASATSAKVLTGASALVTLGKGFALGVVVSLGLVGVARLEAARPAVSRPLESPPVRLPSPTAAPAGKAPLLTANPVPELPRTAASAAFAVGEASAESQPSSPPARAPSSPGVPESSPRLTEPRAAATSSVAAFPIAEGHAASPQAELERRSQLEEEAALLRRARAELRGNRLAEAFATLEASREKFSLPELSQEREALLVELLFQSGQRASAVEKARRFLVQYPNSPHAAQVRSIAQAGSR